MPLLSVFPGSRTILLYHCMPMLHIFIQMDMIHVLIFMNVVCFIRCLSLLIMGMDIIFQSLVSGLLTGG